MWLLYKIEPESSFYNSVNADSIKGELDVEIFKKSLDFLISRHESLRTNFKEIDEELVQIVHDKNDFSLKFKDLSRIKSEKKKKEEEETMIREESGRPFKLESDRHLFRVVLIRRSKEDYTLTLVMHHIITDWWSFVVFYRDLCYAYISFLRGKTPPLPPLTLQYKDYASWEQSKEGRAVFKEGEKYWIKKLSGSLPALNLPTDKTRPPLQTYSGSTENITIDNELFENIEKFCQKKNTTVFIYLFSVFDVFLRRITGEEDIIIGTPFLGKRTNGLEDVIGIFINNLPIRTNLANDSTFMALLKKNRNIILEAMAKQDYSFDRLIEKLDLKRDLSRSPIFSVMFQYDTKIRVGLNLDGLEAVHRDFYNNTTKFDLKMRFSSFLQKGTTLYCEYNTDLFCANTIKTFLRTIKVLMSSALDNPEKKISDLEIITPEEKNSLSLGYCGARIKYPENKTIHGLFEEQVKKTPDNMALECGARRLTYHELNKKANQLAHYLLESGAKKAAVTGMLLNHSIDLIIAELAILKAGGICLPIDAKYPRERIDYMLKDAGISTLIVNDDNKNIFNANKRIVINLDDADLQEKLNRQDDDNPGKSSISDDLAYLMYTSGSTGQPKGVMLGHKNMVQEIFARINAADITPRDKFCLSSFQGWFLSVQQIFLPLFMGSPLFIYPEETINDPLAFFTCIDRDKISVIEIVVQSLSLYISLIDESEKNKKGLRYLRILWTIGKDAPDLVNRFYSEYKHVQYMIAYGTTESGMTLYRKTDHNIKYNKITEGKPVANTDVFILNSTGTGLTPPGLIGELYVAGERLFKGYLNDPVKSRKVLLPHPFFKDVKIYKTGDLARIHTDGNIEILGRVDSQIKVRGIRVEPGEVEICLRASSASIKDCVVVKYEESLAAYYTVTNRGIVEIEKLKNSLKTKLPGYMIPAYFVRLDKFPQTATGKIDLKKLPLPTEKDLEKKKYEAPRGTTEKRLAMIWQEVLGIKKISRHDNFFDLGGHSLKAIRLLSRINRELAVDLPLKEVFQYSTIKNLARIIAGRVKSEPPQSAPTAKPRKYYPLTLGQAAFWRAVRNKKAATSNILTILEFAGKPDLNAFRLALQEIINRHEALRANFIMKNGKPVQVIKKSVAVKLESINLLNVKDVKRAVAGVARKEAEKPFDLKGGLLIRFKFIKTGKDASLLVIAVHHLVFDHYSHHVFLNDLRNIYGSLSGGKKPAAISSLKYTDCLLRETELKEKDLPRQEKYWQDKFFDKYPALELPADKFIKSGRSAKWENMEFMSVEGATADKIKRICQNLNITPFMFFLAVYNIFLYKITGKTDIMVGTPANTRNSEEESGVIGMFVSNLALRNRIEEGDSFADLASRVRENVIDALENRNLPFSDLVEKNLRPVDPARPLLNIFFRTIYLDGNFDTAFSDGLTIKPQRIGFRNVPFDLELAVVAGPTWTQLVLVYNRDLFQKETVEKLLSYFYSMLKTIGSDPGVKIAGIKAWKK